MSQISRRDSLFYLAVAGLVIIPFEILRLKRPDLNKAFVRFFKRIMRIEEVATMSGVSFVIVGTFIVVLCFPREIAILSVLLLAFGDPASSIFGVLFGRDKIWGRKSLQGSLACFTVCTVVCGVYFYVNNIMVDRIILVSLLGGLVGALSELAEYRKLDDNLTFPIFAALGLQVLFTVFGGFSVL